MWKTKESMQCPFKKRGKHSLLTCFTKEWLLLKVLIAIQNAGLRDKNMLRGRRQNCGLLRSGTFPPMVCFLEDNSEGALSAITMEMTQAAIVREELQPV